ncbi:unnamed protein product [Cuscuta europaea]|uniref:Uncharacterized protein n=1 Tax=Cuscuta europaea TaxID=41803 RepID=A0A9P0ZCD6_CUSEU|nr:unnamed protein product [Cuscuta europaea]
MTGWLCLNLDQGGEKMAYRLERLAAKAGSTTGSLVSVRRIQTQGAIEVAPEKSSGFTQGDGAATLPTSAADLRPPMTRCREEAGIPAHLRSQREEGQNSQNAPTPLHIIRLTMRSRSASRLHYGTVNPASLALAITLLLTEKSSGI